MAEEKNVEQKLKEIEEHKRELEAFIKERRRRVEEALPPLKVAEMPTPALPEDLAAIIRRLYPELTEAEIPEAELPSVALKTLSDWIVKDPEGFLDDLRRKGRTTDTETLLRALIPKITPEDLTAFFEGIVPAPDVKFAELERLTKKLFPEADVETTLKWAVENPTAFEQRIKDIGQTPDTEALVKLLYPEISRERLAKFFIKPKWYEKIWGALVAGTGDALLISSSALSWIGQKLNIPEVKNPVLQLKALGEQLQASFISPATEEEMTWRTFGNPEWWATTIPRAAPLMAGLMIAGILSFVGGAKGAAAIGLGAFGRLIIGSLVGSAVGRSTEGALEAGSVYDEMLRRGVSEEEARKTADKVFQDNLKLAGVDAAQLATMFFPLGRLGANSRLIQQLLSRRMAVSAFKVPAIGVMEAGEEGYQAMVQRRAMGDPVPGLFPLLTEERAIGFIFGAAMGGAGSVIDLLTARIKNDMPPDVLQEYNRQKEEGLKVGLTEVEAELAALDGVAETQRGKASILGTMEDLKEKTRGLEPKVEERPALMDIPDSESILDGIMADTWMRQFVQAMAKVPVVSKLVEWGLGRRVLVKRQSEAIEDIVGRGRFLHSEITRRAEGAKAIAYWTLFNISSNPVELFGFKRKMKSKAGIEYEVPISDKIRRVHPEADGTMEDIFTHPDRYALNKKQLEYVKAVHELNERILAMLKKEGVAPENVSHDWWMHRVVEGKFDPDGELIKVRGRPGVKGGRIGAKVSFEMHRKAPTMMEGITWGILYGRNPAESVSTYIEEAFKKIADARFEKYMAKELEPLAQMGVLPREELLRRFPEVVERAIITAEELADANNFVDKINRALRGEKLPEQTLRAIERRFPELGKKFRALVEEPATAEKGLREVLSQQERIIKELQKRMQKVKEVDVEAIRAEATAEVRAEIEAEVRAPIPDDAKLIEAFKIMSYEDRLAYREAMNSRLAELGQILDEQTGELAGIEEVLTTDPVARYRGKVGKRELPLTALLVRGEFPESILLVQAELLLMGRKIKPDLVFRGPKGEPRVRWEYLIDELADHFKMTEQELINRIESIAKQKQRAEDLKVLVKEADDAFKHLKHTLELLDQVDTQPANIPEFEARPEPEVPVEPIPIKVKREEMTISEFKETLSKVLAETKAELKNTLEWLRRAKMLKAAKAKEAPDQRLIDEERARVKALRDRIPTFEEMLAKPDEYFPRLKTEFPHIYELLLDRGREMRIIPAKPPLVEVEITEAIWEKLPVEPVAPKVTPPRGGIFETKKINQLLREGRIERVYEADIEAKVKELLTPEEFSEWSAQGGYYRSVADLARGQVVSTNALIRAGWVFDSDAAVWYKPVIPAPAEIPRVEVPRPEPGMPEPGLQQDMFGHAQPVFPTGKGKVTQISMDDYLKLVEMWKKAGLSEDSIPVALKPKVEGVKGMEEETTAQKVTYEIPPIKDPKERKKALNDLKGEVKRLVEERRVPFWEARHERALRMEQMRQPGIGEGYIMHPVFQGRKFDQEFIDAFNKYFGHDAGLPGLNVTADIAGVMRILKAALDFSQPLIQGTLAWGLAHSYLVTNPPVGIRMMGAWYRMFFEQIGAFFNPGITAKFMEANKEAAMERIAYGGSARAVYLFQEMAAVVGKGTLATWSEKALRYIPLQPYQRAEIAFFTGGEIVRDRFWRILSPKAIREGKGFELARYLDLLTGIADPRAMGVPMTIRQLEQSWIFFSSAYTRSYLTLVAEIFRGGMTGGQARAALAGVIVAGTAYLTGIILAKTALEGKDEDESWDEVQKALGLEYDPITKEWLWRPTSAFMSIKIGDTYYGIGGGIYGLMRLAGNIQATIQEVGERERIDLIRIMKHGSLNRRDNPFIAWWYSRSSAFFSTIHEAVTGQEFLGYPIEGIEGYAKYLIRRFLPIWVERNINSLRPDRAGDREIPEEELPERIAKIGAEIFGLRVNPEYAWEKFYEKANEYIKFIPEEELDVKQRQAWREGKLKWKHLTEIQKRNLLFRNPELRETYEDAQTDSDLRASPHWKAWEGRQKVEREAYYERGRNLMERLVAGELNTRDLRKMWGEAGQNYGIALDMITKDPRFKPIYDYFEKQRKKGDKYQFEADLALAHYIEIMFKEYVDEKGDIDWEAKDKAIDEFIAKWGVDYYELIREMYAQKRLMEGMPPALVRLADDKDKLGREYWRLPYKPIIDMDKKDETKGNIPAEYYALWKEYQALKTRAEREAFIEWYPDMAKDWRAEYRKANPEDDARLALWGYGGKLQSREAYDLVVKWGRELGIPLEQMGLGLPPVSLIDTYFKHNELVLKFGGNSAEVKLHRLENPLWDAWGRGQMGWLDIETPIQSLRISVKWRDMDKLYESFADRQSPNYKATTEEREKARKELLDANPEYHKDRRRRDAYDIGFPEKLIETYATYYTSPALKKPADWKYDEWYEDDWFLMENPEFYKAMRDRGVFTVEKDFSKVPTREVWALYEMYLNLPKGKARTDFRRKYKQLDAWLVKAKGLKPVK